MEKIWKTRKTHKFTNFLKTIQGYLPPLPLHQTPWPDARHPVVFNNQWLQETANLSSMLKLPSLQPLVPHHPR